MEKVYHHESADGKVTATIRIKGSRMPRAFDYGPGDKVREKQQELLMSNRGSKSAVTKSI